MFMEQFCKCSLPLPLGILLAPSTWCNRTVWTTPSWTELFQGKDISYSLSYSTNLLCLDYGRFLVKALEWRFTVSGPVRSFLSLLLLFRAHVRNIIKNGQSTWPSRLTYIIAIVLIINELTILHNIVIALTSELWECLQVIRACYFT